MADSRILFQTQPWIPVDNRIATNQKNVPQGVPKTKPRNEFADVLQRETADVKFSQHALVRMQSRGLRLDPQDLLKLNDAVDRIAQKGARESLVYLNDVALVVSVKNRTVITAMDGSSAKETIFTNIDSAVIL